MNSALSELIFTHIEIYMGERQLIVNKISFPHAKQASWHIFLIS